MAGDWIKMRVWLRRDPRVIWMADVLAVDRRFMDWLTGPAQRTCDESAYEHVTRDVTASLCVTALLEVWGTAREQGRRFGNDLIVDKCDTSVIDAICSLPGFGAALAEVGWFAENSDGSATFPKFFAEKDSPSKRHSAGAARQARYREKKRKLRGVTNDVTGDVTGDAQSDVTSDVTRNVTGDVTGDVEKRREEKIYNNTHTHNSSNLICALKPPWNSGECARIFDEWFSYLSTHGKPPLDKALAAHSLSNLFETPSDLRQGVATAIANGWVTLRPSMIEKRQSKRTEAPEAPYEKLYQKQS